MDRQKEKCVVVIDQGLPPGVAANTAAILGITLGRERPEVVGADVTDRDGGRHRGIIEFPVPVLRSTAEGIREIREKLSRPELEELTVVDFSDLAQGCRTYGEFAEKMGRTPESGLRYFGLAICGDRKKVDRLTGSLPLLR